MKPENISDIVFRQEFRSWREVQDVLSPQGYLWMQAFFEDEDRAALCQVHHLRLSVLGIVWHETEGKVTSSPAESPAGNTKKR